MRPLKTEEEVYELILSDLKIAETGCPAMYTKEPYARKRNEYCRK